MKTVKKWKLGLYVAVIFVAGGGTGSFVTWRLTRHLMYTTPNTQELGARLKSGFRSRLNLTPGQTAVVDPWVDQAMSQVDLIHQDMAARIFANVSNLNFQVARGLTPEQKLKLEEYDRERRARLRKKLGPP